MAASKKSAKRTTAKKRPTARSSRSKKPARKASSKSGSRKATAKAAASKPRRRKASRTALGGLDTVRQVGEKTWETLKSTTAQVVEGVKETFGG